MMTQVVSRNPAVDLAPMKNESVLFQPETNKFCLLNFTAAFLWNQLERPCTVSELAEKICGHFDGVTLQQAERDVEIVVNELLSQKCLESSQI
jgi:hypothetical protein